MNRPRFTIGGILAFMLLLAIGLAALKEASEAWDAGLLGFTLLVLLGSILLATHRRGSSRAYWLGFALFGGAYLGLCQVPAIEARLPTTQGLDSLGSLVYLPETFSRRVSTPGGVKAYRSAYADKFLGIGHSLLALILACIGGVASRFLHDRASSIPPGSRDQETSTNSPTSSAVPAGSAASIRMPWKLR